MRMYGIGFNKKKNCEDLQMLDLKIVPITKNGFSYFPRLLFSYL